MGGDLLRPAAERLGQPADGRGSVAALPPRQRVICHDDIQDIGQSGTAGGPDGRLS
jgi:hypothetical protein